MPVQLKEEVGRYDIFCGSTGHNLQIHTIRAETLNLEIPEYNAVTGIVNNMARGEPHTLILWVSKEQLGHMSGYSGSLKLVMEGCGARMAESPTGNIKF